MSQNKLELRRSASLAGRGAVAATVTICTVIVVRAVVNGLFSGKGYFNWYFSFGRAAAFGIGWFCFSFLYWAIRLRADAPAEEILDTVSSDDGATKTQLSGFVAMEYFALILNRTFVIFIAPDGLYGWKASGPVAAGNPLYFQPFADMLADPKLMHDITAVHKLAKLKGGFIIRRSEITSADVVRKQKWGMAGIPHSGRILIHLASGAKREFIVLGNVDSDRIQQSILS